MKPILVTGATGFVGRGLIERLRQDGVPIRAALRRPVAIEGVETVTVGEIGAGTDWGRALDGVQTVVHLAGLAHVAAARGSGGDNPFRTVNVEGTARLARAAEQAGAGRFVLMSSVKAVGETSAGRPLTEADPPTPLTPYGVSKWEGEQALRAAASRMATVVLRPPLVYGPGVGANFRTLLRLVQSGLPLPLAGIRNRRSLVARANLVDAVMVAMAAPGVAGGTFFVADGPPLSTEGLIRALAAALGKPARLFSFPPGLMLALARAAGKNDAAISLLGSLEIDDRAFRAATGWVPPVAPEAALRQVAMWYKAGGGHEGLRDVS